MQVMYYYPVDESSLYTGGEKTTANYLLFKKTRRNTLLCWYGFYMFFTCFQMDIALVIYNWDVLCFQMVHFVGMPVMCSDMLQNSMHEVC